MKHISEVLDNLVDNMEDKQVVKMVRKNGGLRKARVNPYEMPFDEFKKLYNSDRSYDAMSKEIGCSGSAVARRVRDHIEAEQLVQRSPIKKGGGNTCKESGYIIVTRHSKRNPLTMAINKLGNRFKERLNKYGDAEYYLDDKPASIWNLFTAANIKVLDASTSH